MTGTVRVAVESIPDLTKDLEKLKAQAARMRGECEDILDRLGLRHLIVEKEVDLG